MAETETQANGMVSDAELLRRYAGSADDEAFSEVVRRYANLVYVTALRVLGDGSAAEDASQAVFLVLARKAGNLGEVERLAVWLFRTTENVARPMARARARRTKHEAEAGSMRSVTDEDRGSWETVWPLVDRAIASLPTRYADAIVFRFLQGMTVRQTAEALGCPERTAETRIGRALSKLRARLDSRGVGLSVGGLGLLLTDRGNVVAPPGLTETIQAICQGQATVSAGVSNMVEATMKAMMWAKVKMAAAAVAAVVGVVAGGGLVARHLVAAGEMAKPVAVEAGTAVLTEQSYWRAFVMRGPNVAPLELLKESKSDAAGPATFGKDVETSPPPDEWAGPDYDDSFWGRSRGPFGNRKAYAGAYSDDYWAMLCLRGKFRVDDPAAVGKLTLTCAYHGGLAVRLNGKEVLRRHLPALSLSNGPEGRLGPEAMGAAYPREAYVDAAGKVIPSPWDLITRFKNDADLAERVKKRDPRILEPVELPVNLLRKGVNILAVEVRRSAYRPEGLKWKKHEDWSHVGLLVLRLAADGAGVKPNVSAPNDFQVWNQDIYRLFSVGDYGDPGEALRPIRLAGARNGWYSGQVVIRSATAIEKIQAVVTDLVREGGAGNVPAAEARVRYAAAFKKGEVFGTGPKIMDWAGVPWPFAALEEAPPSRVEPESLGKADAPTAVQPVWVTVHVPKDAPAGKYRGRLDISAAGLPKTEAPIEMEVIDWTLPDIREHPGYMNFYQSPETLAAHYDVPMWSEEHWKLMEKSWQLLGGLGNNLVVIPLLNRTQYGNDECWVPWIKQAGGSYKYDFTVHDRYLELARKYCRVNLVSYQVWCPRGWGGEPPSAHKEAVTVIDPSTGKREAMDLPDYCTEECANRWKPLIAAVREHLKAHGGEALPVLGASLDAGIHKDLVAWFKELWPDAGGWHYGAHGRGAGLGGKGMKLMEYMYVPSEIGPPGSGPGGSGSKRTYDWWTPHPQGAIILMSQRVYDSGQPPLMMRTMPERSMLLGDNGCGRMCLDYWPAKGKKEKGGSAGSLFGRWPMSDTAQRNPHLRMLSLPGRDGAVATIKSEAFREGLQEFQARAFVEMAVVKKNVEGDLAARCRKLLDRRWQLCRISHEGSCDDVYNEGWQKRSEDLYRLAAEVAKNPDGK
ncbi:MAG: sigma-70 family RNA polymerase sigma factor [Planctomycetota bacterium]